MKNLVEGMKFRVKEIKNPIIDTKIRNIVEVVTTNEKTTEFRDITTFDWFIVDNDNIGNCLEICQ